MSKLASYMGLGSPQSNVEIVSPASTSYALTLNQQGKLLAFETGAAQINLPAPETGMVYNILFLAGPTQATTPTKIDSSGYDILCDASTAKAVCNETTVENGVGISLFAINEFRWVASRFGGSTLNINSTTT